MRLALIFLLGVCCVGTSYGGVVDWTQSREDQAIYLFQQYCAGGQDKGSNGAVRWYCKRPKDYSPPQEFHHRKVIHSQPHNSKQIVFIQTPSRVFKHHVRVDGEAEFNHDTDIYVVPGKDEHYVDIQADIRTRQGHEGKPHTFYLKNNPNDEYLTSPYPKPPISSHYYDPPSEVFVNSKFQPPQEVEYDPFPVVAGYGNRRHRKRSFRRRQQQPEQSENVHAQQESRNVPRRLNFQDFQTTQ